MSAETLVYILAISNGLMLAVGAFIGYWDEAHGWDRPKARRRRTLFRH